MRPEQKELERKYLDMLRAKVPEMPVGSITSPEPPDFLIDAPSQLLAVEVTRMYQSEAAKLHESEEEKIVSAAQALAEKICLPPLMVSVFFSVHARPTSSMRQKLARQVADAVIACVEAAGPPSPEVEQIECDEANLPDAISHVSIYRIPILKSHRWENSNGGIVQEECIEDLQRVIDAKNVKHANIWSKCKEASKRNEAWLLVVADWKGPSSFYEPSETTKLHPFQSPFDRIYFLEFFTGNVVWLRLAT